MQISNFAIGKSSPHHNRTSTVLYGWWDKGGCSSFTNSSLHIDPPIWTQRFRTLIFMLNDFIPLLSCLVFVQLSQLEHFDIVLLTQQWFLDSNYSLNFTVFSSWMLTYFHVIGSVVQWCIAWSSQPSVTQTGDLWNRPLTFIVAFGRVLSCFLTSPNDIKYCSSGLFYLYYKRRKTPSNQFFHEDLYLV